MTWRVGITSSIALILILYFFVESAITGPLDRSPMDTRRNPAAEDMIRIPGVIGLSFNEAMSILQQAGLSPLIEITKDKNEKFEGMEGRVVSQEPNPGGVAMIGSSVTVTFYMKAMPEKSYHGWDDYIYPEYPGDGDYIYPEYQ